MRGVQSTCGTILIMKLGLASDFNSGAWSSSRCLFVLSSTRSASDASATAPFPYACVADEARGRIYVSLWAQSAVLVLDAQGKEIDRVFDDLARLLPGFLDRVLERQGRGPELLPLPGPFPAERQRALKKPLDLGKIPA